jgi:hypothetical protein
VGILAAAVMALAGAVRQRASGGTQPRRERAPLHHRTRDPSHRYTFFATNKDLAAHGYVEEEFVFEGRQTATTRRR